MRKNVAVVALSGALLALALAPSAQGGTPRLILIDNDDEDCYEFIPQRTSALYQEPGRVSLDALVLLDGVDAVRGDVVLSQAAKSYRPFQVDLRWDFRPVVVPATGGTSSRPTIESQDLIDASRALVGGRRPDGYDVVYTLTSKDLLTDGDPGNAGMADCIGGVRFPQYAFAVGENLTRSDDASIVASHEIGHLMGAHHHYFNCVETAFDEGGPCTVMSPIVNYGAIDFGTLEAMVVRGHAEDFARP